MPVQVKTLLYPVVLPPQSKGAIATYAIVTKDTHLKMRLKNALQYLL